MVETGAQEYRETGSDAWRPTTLVLLTVAWLVAVFIFARRWLSAGLDQWSASYDGVADAQHVVIATRANTAAVLLLAVLGGGPSVIAAVAAFFRYRVTAVMFGLAAAPFVLLGLAVLVQAQRHANDDAPAPPYSSHCVEHSDGDTRCQGG